MTDQHAGGVLNFVIYKHIQTETYREGMKNVTRASFHMEPEMLVPLLKFLVDKESCTLEQAMSRFTTSRDAAMQVKAKAGKESGSWFGVFLAVLLSAGAALLLYALSGDSLIMNVLPAIVVPAVFFWILYTMVWSPRHRVMENIWAQDAGIEDRLEELYKAQSAPILELIGDNCRGQGLAFLCAAVICIGGMTAVATSSALEKANFSKTFEAVAVSADNRGTRYVVYDNEKERYVDGYLAEGRQALTAADVIGVLYLTEGETVVGTYTGGGNAYQCHVTVKLVDQQTGEVVGEKKIYGGDPPSTIVTRNPIGKKDGYGSAPDKEEIADTCESLIRTYEEGRAQKAFHQEMSKVSVSADRTGDRYVVYDTDQALYLNKYLSEERQADTADEVIGVLIISGGEREVGTYSDDGKAYQRYVMISLVDQRTGMGAGFDWVLGGDPPKTIYSFQKDGYGDYPAEADIAAKCEALIAAFEAE